MTMMLIDSENFRRRCASALTHPATVAALVLLLLNDGLFKSLWPDSWVTGKLSDLAWVVFASPLLAFVLSLFLGRRLFGRRMAIITAYVGLPALYAAFNTFEPIHDRILWGLSLVSGGTAGSPLDPSDSLVIPFGLGIAVWVLRRRPVGRDRLRVRLALLAAGVATFATVATSYPVPGIGVGGVGVAEDGSIVADTDRAKESSFHYRSADGGLTWAQDQQSANIKWGILDMETPRGTFMIQGSDLLVRTIDEEPSVAYSAAYLQNEVNIWVQEHATTRLGLRKIGTRPYGITYDERSGNVIIAMGLQGIVVGSPDGQWRRIAVGRFSPTDFSPPSKSLAMLSATVLWVTTITISVSMTAISIVLAQYRRENAGLGVAVSLATFVLFAGIPYLLSALRLDEVFLSVIPVLMGMPLILAIYLPFAPKGNRMTRHLALAMGTICAIASGAFLVSFDASGDFGSNIAIVAFATLVVLFAITAMSVCWRQLRPRRAVLAGLAGMNGLTVLVFLMWVQLDFGLTFAKIAAFTLVALVALGLTRYIRRRQQPGQGTD